MILPQLWIIILVSVLLEFSFYVWKVFARLMLYGPTIVLPTRTTRHSWAIAESMQHEPLLAYTTCLYMLFSYTQNADYADSADETTLRDYTRLRPACQRLREQSYKISSIISHTLKTRCSYEISFAYGERNLETYTNLHKVESAMVISRLGLQGQGC